MNKPNNKKELLLNELHHQLEKKAETLRQVIASAKESRDNETKSSAGDKYETGRAMVQMEIEKNNAQLNSILHLKNELSKIDIQKKYDQAEFGSLLHSNQGNYFLSIGFGKIVIAEEVYYCISISSPIGQILHQKQEGDSFEFQGRKHQVSNIC